ncbi:MAG: SDR family oxidoreductase [Gemmatimonadota bacterium]
MNDRVVLVTGGAGNLGRAVTRAFLEAGARVAVPFYKTDQPTALDALSNEFGDRLHTFALDLTTERGAEQAVRQTVEWGGQLGSLVHLVGGYVGGYSLADTPLDAWTRMLDLNMTSSFLASRFAVPRLVEAGGGSLVFVASRAAFEDRKNRAAYSAAKAGVVALAKALAEEYADSGIRSNVIVPDTIDTEANRRANPDEDYSRWVRPEEIAEIIVFLASARSAPINGAALPVYGGP